MKPTAVVHIDKDGEFTFHAEPGCSLLVIDERCQHDRVYEIQSDLTKRELVGLVGSDEIGHLYDQSGLTEDAMQAVEADPDVKPTKTALN